MKTEKTLFLDFETFSHVDIKTRGAWNYAKEAGALLLSYRFSNWAKGKVKFVTNWDREELTEADFPDEIKNFRGPVVVHNWAFEHAIFTHVLPFLTYFTNAQVYRCTAATARRMGLPGDLDGACRALNLPNLKDKAEGTKLIRKYSVPDKNGLFRPIPPDDRKKWLGYGKGDVLAMENLYNVLPPLHLDAFEWPVFQLDKVMNLRGLTVDRKGVEHLKELYEKAVTITEKKAEKLCGKEKSGTLTVSSPSGFRS